MTAGENFLRDLRGVKDLTRVYEGTDVGKIRKINEDCGAVLDEHTCIVADGMGGHAAGEVASRALVEAVRRTLRETGAAVDAEVLEKAILRGNREILDMVREYPSYRGMGTTATLFHYEAGKGIWAHVGDSRIYLCHQGDLRRMTRDHSYVESLVECGTITPEEARNHPRKNLLIRAVGVEEDVKVDTGSFPVAGGDKILLCTDGLTNMVSDEEILDILRSDVENPVALLIGKALAAGGTDNITAIVVAYDG